MRIRKNGFDSWRGVIVSVESPECEEEFLARFEEALRRRFAPSKDPVTGEVPRTLTDDEFIARIRDALLVYTDPWDLGSGPQAAPS